MRWLFPQWSARGLQAITVVQKPTLFTANVFDVAKILRSVAFCFVVVEHIALFLLFARHKIAIKPFAVTPPRSTRKSSILTRFCQLLKKTRGEKLWKPLENEP